MAADKNVVDIDNVDFKSMTAGGADNHADGGSRTPTAIDPAVKKDGGATFVETAGPQTPPKKEGMAPASLKISDGYETVSQIRVASGEADIYVVKNREGARFVLKYYRFGFEPKSDIVDLIKRLPAEDVVRTIEFARSAEGRFYEIQEYVEYGTLADFLRNNKPVSHNFVVEFVREIASCLKTIHEKNIIHRDIKPENILIRSVSPLDLVLTDFGISSVSKFDLHQTSLSRTVVYSAPESMTGVISRTVDYWAVGIITLEMLIGKNPYDGIDERAVLYSLTTKPVPCVDEVPEKFGPLVKGLLTRDPEKRWRHAQIEKWLGGASDIPVHFDRQPAGSGDGNAESAPADDARSAAGVAELAKKYALPPKALKLALSPGAPGSKEAAEYIAELSMGGFLVGIDEYHEYFRTSRANKNTLDRWYVLLSRCVKNRVPVGYYDIVAGMEPMLDGDVADFETAMAHYALAGLNSPDVVFTDEDRRILTSLGPLNRANNVQMALVLAASAAFLWFYGIYGIGGIFCFWLVTHLCLSWFLKLYYRRHAARIRDIARRFRDIRPEAEDEAPAGSGKLFEAISERSLPKLRRIIGSGGDSKVNAASEEGESPLIAAARTGDFEIVSYLLKNGADPSFEDQEGNCALIASCERGNPETIKALLAAGSYVNAKNLFERTALATAASCGHLDAVKTLAEAGADVNTTDSQGKTPAALAREAGFADVAEYLQKRGGR